MSYIEVLRLWKKETNIIEHKSQWRDEWLQWICGFANNQGGVINIGLNDKGQPVGLQKVKKLAEILEVSERHVKRYISYLREKGFLDRTKNNRYGERIIKK